jgi:hypothetical protein
VCGTEKGFQNAVVRGWLHSGLIFVCFQQKKAFNWAAFDWGCVWHSSLGIINPNSAMHDYTTQVTERIGQRRSDELRLMSIAFSCTKCGISRGPRAGGRAIAAIV